MPTKPVNERCVNLENGERLLIREAHPDDARAFLDYVEAISEESDFLSFGPGEHGFSEARQQEVISEYQEKDNRLFILGFIGDVIVTSLSFAGGPRPRTRHAGEFGLSVRKMYWGVGIGSCMLDTLIEWAKTHPC